MGTPQNPQRALVMQGGGSLAAFEAGVFSNLYSRLSELDRQKGRKGNTFDIVAGTSGGAINAAIIVSHVLKNSWEGIAEKPTEFWRATSSDISFWTKNPFVSEGWKRIEALRIQSNDFWRNVFDLPWFKAIRASREESPLRPWFFAWPDSYGPLASEEAARRYLAFYLYSVGFLGTPGVLTPVVFQQDFRFMWNPFNVLLRYGNSPLTLTIKKFWDFENNKIRTTEDQPRLMFVTVDVRDGMTVTFDSYPKEDGTLKTEYSHPRDGNKIEKHVIKYKEGLGIEHLLPSMSSAIRLVPPSLEATTEVYPDGEKNPPPGKQDTRYFWDGYYLSNTPLREVLQAHREYWQTKKKPESQSLQEITEAKVPDLEVFIVNMYPTLDKEDYPKDPDAVQKRIDDVVHHDKTEYDEKMANIVSDYVHLARFLLKTGIDNAKDKQKVENEILKLMREKTLSKGRGDAKRTYSHLLTGRFKITKLHRIELTADDRDDIYGKAFDFSRETIERLVEQGHRTAAKVDFG